MKLIAWAAIGVFGLDQNFQLMPGQRIPEGTQRILGTRSRIDEHSLARAERHPEKLVANS
jgi:hypothetical protein